MYRNSFYIDTCVGNNQFSFHKRPNKSLFVASLKRVQNFGEIELGTEVVFEDYSCDGRLLSHKGLKHFYEMSWGGKPLFLFDNHNHAFYFWYLARYMGTIGDGNILIHIDEHADTRNSNKYLLKPESYDLEKIFYFTNYVLNVGNYILPAQKEGIIGNIIQIRSEYDLLLYTRNKGVDRSNIILNLDLDFFQPELDFIDYNLKKRTILDVASKARLITVATSPFFIDQTLALEVFEDIFS